MPPALSSRSRGTRCTQQSKGEPEEWHGVVSASGGYPGHSELHAAALVRVAHGAELGRHSGCTATSHMTYSTPHLPPHLLPPGRGAYGEK